MQERPLANNSDMAKRSFRAYVISMKFAGHSVSSHSDELSLFVTRAGLSLSLNSPVVLLLSLVSV